MGQANHDRTQEWQLKTGLQNHFTCGPHELCKNNSDTICTIFRLIPKTFSFAFIHPATALAAQYLYFQVGQGRRPTFSARLYVLISLSPFLMTPEKVASITTCLSITL